MNKKTRNILNKCLNKVKKISKDELHQHLNNHSIDHKIEYEKFNIIPFKNKYIIEIFTKEFGYVNILDSQNELQPAYFNSINECEEYIRNNFKGEYK